MWGGVLLQEAPPRPLQGSGRERSPLAWDLKDEQSLPVGGGGSAFQAGARQGHWAGGGSCGILGESLSFSRNVDLEQNAD